MPNRRTADVSGGDTATAKQYNDLRKEALASSMFEAQQQATPDLTLKVSPGVCYINGERIDFAGGNSPSFTAPTTHPRIDLLTIDDNGDLIRNAGTEAASPAEPALPANEIPLCLVYNRVGQTSIKESDDSSNGYISKDARNFLDKTREPKVTTYTSGSGNFPVSKDVSYFIVEVQGGGANGASGWSGGAGGYAKRLVKASEIDFSKNIPYSVGGIGVASTFGNVDSIGIEVVGNGGSLASSGQGSGGGTGVGGNLINMSGGNGGRAITTQATSTTTINAIGSDGGDSFLGRGGRGNQGSATSPYNANGGAASLYGAGGGSATGTGTGGAGTAGIIIIIEYFN